MEPQPRQNVKYAYDMDLTRPLFTILCKVMKTTKKSNNFQIFTRHKSISYFFALKHDTSVTLLTVKKARRGPGSVRRVGRGPKRPAVVKKKKNKTKTKKKKTRNKKKGDQDFVCRDFTVAVVA